MKRLSKLTICISIFLMIAGTSVAAPIPFIHEVDFFGSGTDGSRTYLDIKDWDTNYPYAYNHVLAFDPCANDVCNVTLAFTHKGNNPGYIANTASSEIWLLNSGTNVFIGYLARSAGVWVTDTFPIGSSLFPSFPASSWTFSVKIEENTSGDDNFVIDKSVLSGNYNCTQVPEPTTMLLLGLGLVGLAGVRRKFHN